MHHAPLPSSPLALLLRFYTENRFGSISNKKLQRNLLLKGCTAPSFSPKKHSWSRLAIAYRSVAE